MYPRGNVYWLCSVCGLICTFCLAPFQYECFSNTYQCVCRWSGLSSEEVYRAVVKARTLPPQYTSVRGGGIPGDLWKMIGDCLQFKASKRPTFHAMLGIFLRHLQGIPRSPPASPDK